MSFTLSPVTSALAALLLVTLAGCAGDADFRPVNVPATHDTIISQNPILSHDNTIVALAFSGGGMRASAFSYGVLKTLSETPAPADIRAYGHKTLADSVDFVSGVSGGSVTAAYFVLKGPETFLDFREKFLNQNAESGFGTELSLSNILRILTFGGVNDRRAFPVWLDKHVFHDATYADILKKNRPVLWIGASDIFNRTPFIFSTATFGPLCSDLSQLPLSQAVAASAAVPGAFTPVNMESFAERCQWKPPVWSTREDLYYSQRALLEAFKRYRDKSHLKYIKLLDGGLTDNFGVGGVALARLSEGNEYAPLNRNEAIRLKRLLFIVVNAGRSPTNGEWDLRTDNPSIVTLASAVTDTAIDANTRTTYDFFKIVMREWQDKLVEWRCNLPEPDVDAARKHNANWKCDDVHFYVTQVSFADAGLERKEQLDMIPTRFALPAKDIDLLIDSADAALKNNPTFKAFLND
jgi:NTE family protein